MKYIAFLMILFLSSCSIIERDYLYINTLAISKENDLIEVMIIKADEKINAKTYSNTIMEAYDDLDNKIEIVLSLNYLSNVIIEKEFLEEITPLFLDFVTKMDEISLNFHIHTIDNIDNLLETKDIDEISNTKFHISPKKCQNIIHKTFLDFVIDFKENKKICIPYLEMSNSFNQYSLYSDKLIEININ